MEAETTGIAISFGAVGSICTLIGAWIKAKFSRIPQPCNIHAVQDCVSVKECNRRMAEMGQRISNLELQINTGFTAITDKLDALDSKSEERAVAINRRIDPLMAELARSQGQVEFIKDLVNNAYRQATVGGHK